MLSLTEPATHLVPTIGDSMPGPPGSVLHLESDVPASDFIDGCTYVLACPAGRMTRRLRAGYDNGAPVVVLDLPGYEHVPEMRIPLPAWRADFTIGARVHAVAQPV